MIGFFWNVLLALVWVALAGTFSWLSLLAGFLFGYVALAVIQSQITALEGYAQRLPRIILFSGFFFKELVKANLRVAFDVVTPPFHMRPGVIAFQLQARDDFEITLIANLISLTPGTLSLDVSDDRRVLYIHAMFLQDEASLRKELTELERRALNIVR